MTISKQNLADIIAKSCGASKAQGSEALEGVLDAIAGEVARGGEVRLMGFGTFSRKHRAAGMGRNPHTGEPIAVAAMMKPHFAAGKGLKDRVRAAQ